MKPIVVNRKAGHDYFIHEKLEAGICLLGTEVKSLREGRINLKDSYVRLVNHEAFLINCHISHYSKMQGHVEIDPTRTRKLLLKQEEIEWLIAKGQRKGYTIVPLSIYFKKGFAKVEIAIAEGKKLYDKRETIKRKMHDRETQKAVKYHQQKNR